MPLSHIVRHCDVNRSARVLQLEGIFDLPSSKVSQVDWDVDVDLDAKPWNVGLIVGPSGCGKSTIARELFGEFESPHEWDMHKAVVDEFPADMGVKDVVSLLGSVGFNSPPSWLRPYHVLSNGEQFRITIARLLANDDPITVVDEFTSVVDRTVAQIGSSTIAKTVRQRRGKFVRVSCHYDILDWLQPDWIIEPRIGATTSVTWREVQRRPSLHLTIRRVHYSAWDAFRHHHYLNIGMVKFNHSYVGFINGQPVAFVGVQSSPHPKRSSWRLARVVCLPDYQGIAIGGKMVDYIASLYRDTGKPFHYVMSHPAVIAYNRRSPSWIQIRSAGRLAPMSTGGFNASYKATFKRSSSRNRMTVTFQYVGESRPFQGRKFGLAVHA